MLDRRFRKSEYQSGKTSSGIASSLSLPRKYVSESRKGIVSSSTKFFGCGFTACHNICESIDWVIKDALVSIKALS
jgi:hypothetical protein